MGDLAQILVIIRSFSDFSEAMESVGSSAGTDVKTFIEETLQLDNTIKTKIASSDMSVYIVRPGAIFDQETMENEFEEDGTKGEESVGLWRERRKLDCFRGRATRRRFFGNRK
jgi:hypothetical protein